MAQVGDEIYFHAGGKPTCGKIVCHGKHGATVKDDSGTHHKVKWEGVLGHKTRITPAMNVVDQGVDGAIVEDENGRRGYVHGLQQDAPEEPAPTQSKGFEMLGKALVLFAKAGPLKGKAGLHLEDRTDKSGRHGKHWVKGQEAEPAPREKAKPEEPHGSKQGYGTHNLEPGDRVNFEKDGQPADGEITAAGKDGATVKTEHGEHKVYWHEVKGHTPSPDKARIEVPPAKVLGEQKPIAADQFKAADYAKSHDQGDVTADSIIAQFPPETKNQIAAAQERLASIEQTIDTHRHDGKWDDDRKALHQRILIDGGITYKDEDGNEKVSQGLLSEERVKAAMPAPGEKPKFIILGGRGGSGKSSFKGSVYDPAKFIVMDADAIKGLLPEYEGWNAAQVHEESGELFDKAVEMARELGLNIVLDKTMKTAKSAIADVNAFKDAGYSTEAHYMHLPRQEAAKRAVGRFINGGASGRFVPPEVVLSNTTNESAFDSVRELVDKWSFRDNNVPKGAQPILISQSGEAATQEGDDAVEPAAPLSKAHAAPTMILLFRRTS